MDTELEIQEADSRFNTDNFAQSDSYSSGSEGERESSAFDETENENALKPLTKENLMLFEERLIKSGVCYMSRIPPFMKHTKLRSMLSKYGEIGRIYLNPEDAKIAMRRKKYKKNKRVNYVEGWIEFMDKSVARKVSILLNNTNMGGKKRSYYYDDIWNVRYLPKFKWNHLTEQLAYELKVKEQKLKNEMSQAKRENKLYLKNVEKAKMIEAIEAKNIKKGNPESVVKVNRNFRQRKAIASSEPNQ
jgi:ESF2/ABP1 family protein